MTDVEIKNALIGKATISNADHGCLTVWLSLDYGGSGQGFGGYNLGSASLKKYKNVGGNCCGHFINRCLAIAGVSSWDKLEGKTIRVKSGHSNIEAIGHIIKDDWFCPSEDFKEAE